MYENRGCATCHSLDGTRGQGPTLEGFVRSRRISSPTALRLWRMRTTSGNRCSSRRSNVVQGYEPIMPTYQGLDARPRELLGAIEYIKTLK